MDSAWHHLEPGLLQCADTAVALRYTFHLEERRRSLGCGHQAPRIRVRYGHAAHARRAAFSVLEEEPTGSPWSAP
ncbi:hypothetical protein SAMCFNEI73_pC0463 (plasmid) [Sinorhizobium americanum]|uniref:Uncharacterized protein n=1 Tax=Sinorhizobium americanum TaxID=194963 RepID=A0A1L3LVQ2_9HYPH|nr:hypothetical protein SAMCFNEI73_pC0463 [Sinorhizobium americanum]